MLTSRELRIKKICERPQQSYLHCSQNLPYTQYMPTLSIVKTDFGKFIKWGGILIGSIIILFIVFKVLLFFKELILPSSPPPPTVTFGKLPKPYFPDGVKKDFSYEIDTISGKLPAFNLSEKVYKMEQRGPDILAVERASEKVSSLGFGRRPQQISDFVYKWSNPSPPQQNIILNIKLSEFNLSSSYLNFEDDIKNNRFSSETQPIQIAQSFLERLGLYPEDIDEEKTKVELATLDNGVINPTTRVTNATVATVYFFQKNRDELPIVYPQGPNSSMRILVSAGRRGNVLDGKFSHQKILEESATYPIKTSQEAWEDLKNGNAYVASYSGENANVLIKDVYPALYSEGKLQDYLTPVIVFEGTDNFVAYVSAVKDEWISN